MVDYESLTVVCSVVVPNNVGCIVECKCKGLGCAVAEVYSFVCNQVNVSALGCNYLVGEGTSINLSRYRICSALVDYESLAVVCCVVVPNDVGCIVDCKFQCFGCAVAEVYCLVCNQVNVFALGCYNLVGVSTSVNLGRYWISSALVDYESLSIVCSVVVPNDVGCIVDCKFQRFGCAVAEVYCFVSNEVNIFCLCCYNLIGVDTSANLGRYWISSALVYYEGLTIICSVVVPNDVGCIVDCKCESFCCTVAEVYRFVSNEVNAFALSCSYLIGVGTSVNLGCYIICTALVDYESLAVVCCIVVPNDVGCIVDRKGKSFGCAVAEVYCFVSNQVNVFALGCYYLIGEITTANICRHSVCTTFVNHESLTVVCWIVVPNDIGCIVYCKFQCFGCTVAEVYSFVGNQVDIFELGCYDLVGIGTSVNLSRYSISSALVDYESLTVVCSVVVPNDVGCIVDCKCEGLSCAIAETYSFVGNEVDVLALGCNNLIGEMATVYISGNSVSSAFANSIGLTVVGSITVPYYVGCIVYCQSKRFGCSVAEANRIVSQQIDCWRILNIERMSSITTVRSHCNSICTRICYIKSLTCCTG